MPEAASSGECELRRDDICVVQCCHHALMTAITVMYISIAVLFKDFNLLTYATVLWGCLHNNKSESSFVTVLVLTLPLSLSFVLNSKHSFPSLTLAKQYFVTELFILGVQ